MSSDPIRTVRDSAGGWTNTRGADRGNETYDSKADAEAAAFEAALSDRESSRCDVRKLTGASVQRLASACGPPSIELVNSTVGMRRSEVTSA